MAFVPNGGNPFVGPTAPPLPNPGIHWFGPGGSGVAYPQPIRNPVGIGLPGYHPAPLPPGFRQPVGGGGIPRPGIHPAVAQLAAKRAAQRALFLRQRLY